MEIESAVREVKRQIRVCKYALEARLGQQLEETDPVLSWLPRHAADLISRYKVGLDGKTAEQRRTGHSWRKPALEFGEKILFKEARPELRQSTFAPVMEEGRYLGHHGRTGQLLVITSEGVKGGVSFRRLPDDQRWTLQGWDSLRGFPWDIRSYTRREMPQPALGDGEARQPVLDHAMAPPEGPRDFYALAEEVKQFDPTPGCPGCDAVIATGSTKSGHGHSKACRERFMRLLEGDEKRRRRLEA